MNTPLITQDPEIISGALGFTGTRVLVKCLVDYREGSSTLDEFLDDFPSVSRESAVAVLEAARQQRGRNGVRSNVPTIGENLGSGAAGRAATAPGPAEPRPSRHRDLCVQLKNFAALSSVR